jgi:ABC-type uncharacterized transport system ATPase subunit
MDFPERAHRAVNPEPFGTASAALELRGISKRFGSVQALDRCDLVVVPGRVHALLGENGAGKSTLMRIAYGLLPADTGEVRLFGTRIERHSVRDAIRAGVGMVHQHLSLVPNLSAAENLALGNAGKFDPAAAIALLTRTAQSSGLFVPATALVRDLSIVEQQRLEILKALARGARLLILDEPTAVLAPSEIEELLRWIRDFAKGGGSVVLVTHKLREALAVADDVTVLRRGIPVHSGTTRNSSVQDLARSIFPERLDGESLIEPRAPGEVVVSARAIDVMDARGARRIHSASFELRRHEVVGIAAIEGSGHRELLFALAALRAAAGGTLRLPRVIGLIPADRLAEGLVPEFSLTENVALRRAGSRRGLIAWRTLAAKTANLLSRFSIVASSPSAPVRSLSGGNQQRLVVARELESDVDLIVADNPTRGLDMRATAFVHGQLRDAAARGAVVVVHSSDLDEVLALASRVLVVFHGEVREVGADRDGVGRAMLGAA